jgi:hypothetical protein
MDVKTLFGRMLCAMGLHCRLYDGDEYGRRRAECVRCARVEAD